MPEKQYWGKPTPMGRPKGAKNKWHQSPEERKAYLKDYKATHKREEQEYWKEYKRNNSEKIKARYLSNSEANKVKIRARARELKRELLSHYSNGTLKCVKCGFDDYRALTIDHINGGGTAHRRLLKGGFYAWLRKNNLPEGYQTLCMNCQWIKRSENREYKGIAQRINDKN